MTIRIKNWAKFQHFKDRRPPWIKLYRDILDDIEWFQLDPVAAKVLVMLWLIASEMDGYLPDIRKLSFRLRLPEDVLQSTISQLSHWVEEVDQDDIKLVSARYQSDLPERETEREAEAEREGARAPAPAGEGYAFKGRFVRGVNEADFAEWLKAFPTFTRDSLMADLERCDQFYSGKGYTGKPPKNWFVTAFNWIERTHKRALEGKQTRKTPEQIAALRGAI